MEQSQFISFSSNYTLNIAEESVKNKALKYLAVLVDGDKLYKEALVTYDLQLTLMVAHRSQKVDFFQHLFLPCLSLID